MHSRCYVEEKVVDVDDIAYYLKIKTVRTLPSIYIMTQTKISWYHFLSLYLECPSYRESPSGSFSVNVNYNNSEQSCLRSTTTECMECIGERTPDAVRCLQAYLLARFSVSFMFM